MTAPPLVLLETALSRIAFAGALAALLAWSCGSCASCWGSGSGRRGAPRSGSWYLPAWPCPCSPACPGSRSGSGTSPTSIRLSRRTHHRHSSHRCPTIRVPSPVRPVSRGATRLLSRQSLRKVRSQRRPGPSAPGDARLACGHAGPGRSPGRAGNPPFPATPHLASAHGSRCSEAVAGMPCGFCCDAKVTLVTAGEDIGPATSGVFSVVIVLPRACLRGSRGRSCGWYSCTNCCTSAAGMFCSTGWPLASLRCTGGTRWPGWHRRSSAASAELACDAAVLDRLGAEHANSYAQLILKLVEQLRPAQTCPVSRRVFGPAASLSRRIHMIADYRRGTRGTKVLASVLLLLTMGLGLTEVMAEPNATQPGIISANPPSRYLRKYSTTSCWIGGRCSDSDKPCRACG